MASQEKMHSQQKCIFTWDFPMEFFYAHWSVLENVIIIMGSNIFGWSVVAGVSLLMTFIFV